ncbi:MAG: UDP-N-acetylglucosamine--N-acetylmuramyl-(pentapeptide) pyrophosphoryl-undecaprenol N-acetylglucosamine transferase [Acidobacteriaceae bacterium]
MRILFAGGGTGGPIAPMLAVAEEIKRLSPNSEFLFVGSKAGPEKGLVEAAGFEFQAMSAAKLRRYFSLRNFWDAFVFVGSLFRARRIISAFNPDVIFSVGGFVSVPLALIGRLKKITIVIHQQDARPGLANKLVSPMASLVTTAFAETAKMFYSNPGLVKGEKLKRVEWVGNPVRQEFFDKNIKYRDFFKLKSELPVLLIFGGATGARQINEVVSFALPALVQSHQVIHIYGPGNERPNFSDPNYHPYEFLGKEMPSAIKLSDIVICRAGLSSIAELSALGKIAVVVPIPGTHQEENASVLKERAAAVVLSKEEFEPETLVRVVVSLKFNLPRQQTLSRNISDLMPKDSANRIAKLIIETLDAK